MVKHIYYDVAGFVAEYNSSGYLTSSYRLDKTVTDRYEKIRKTVGNAGAEINVAPAGMRGPDTKEEFDDWPRRIDLGEDLPIKPPKPRPAVSDLL